MTSQPRVVAIIQARTGSTRLPGKVLRIVADDTILGHVIRRVRHVAGVEAVVVATTTLAEDAVIAPIAESRGARIVRGSSEDVLARFILAFDEVGGEVGIRVTADCPCLDPILVTAGLHRFLSETATPDYLSNTLERTYPRGYDFEIFRVDALRTAAAEARDAFSREHVTPYLYRHPTRFRLVSFRRDDPGGTAQWRVTLDTPDDWRVIEHLFQRLSSRAPLFGLDDVERYLKSAPEILRWNRSSATTGV